MSPLTCYRVLAACRFSRHLLIDVVTKSSCKLGHPPRAAAGARPGVCEAVDGVRMDVGPLRVLPATGIGTGTVELQRYDCDEL